jgi:hypothetical protein
VNEETAPRTGWRSWFASTGQPPAWALVGYMAAGLIAGVALSSPLPHFRGTMLGALAGLIVAAAGSSGPSLISRRVALITAVLGLVLTAIAFATGGRPVWAAVAMAAVAVLTSLGAAAGPLGAVLGFLLSLAYLLVALMARTANLFELVSFRWAAAHIAVGCLAGLLVVLVGTAWRRRTEPEEVRTATAPPIPVRAMWVSLKTFDEHARDGVRRAIPLAILMYFFQRNGGRDAFWIFFAAYLVMLTPGKNRRARRSSESAARSSACSCSPSRPSSCPTGHSSRSGSSSSLPGSGSARRTPSSVAGSRRSAPACWPVRPPARSATGQDVACSTRLSVARSRWSRPTCSGRETRRPTSRSRSRPSASAACL